MTWLLALLFVLSAGPDDALTTTIEAVGVATVGDDAAQAEREALLDAQRNAVEQAAGVLLRSETVVEQFELIGDTIRTKATGYLARYDVLRQQTVDGAFRVTIRATVKLGPVASDLLEIEAAAERMGRPRLLVLLDESAPEKAADSRPGAREAERLLISKGFELLDAEQFVRLNEGTLLSQALAGDTEALLEAATKQHGEIAVVGRIAARKLEVAIPRMVSAGATVEARVIEVQTGRLIASRTLDLGGGGLPGHSAFDATAAYEGVLRKAATELLTGGDEPLIGRILADWLVRPTTVELAITGLDFWTRRQLLDALTKVVGIDEVLSRSFENETLVVELRGRGKPEDLLDSVHGLAFGERKLSVTGFGGGKAVAEVK